MTTKHQRSKSLIDGGKQFPSFKLRIGGLEFKVGFQKDLTMPGDAELKLNGYCNPDECIIMLRSNTSQGNMQRSFWHEVMHAAVSGITNGSPIDEEHMAELCGRVVVEVMNQEAKIPKCLRTGRP